MNRQKGVSCNFKKWKLCLSLLGRNLFRQEKGSSKTMFKILPIKSPESEFIPFVPGFRTHDGEIPNFLRPIFKFQSQIFDIKALFFVEILVD